MGLMFHRREPRHYHQFSTWMGLPMWFVGAVLLGGLVVCFGVWLLDLVGVIDLGSRGP